MTAIDLVNEKFYAEIYAFFLGLTTPTAGWDPTKSLFIFKSSLPSEPFTWFRIRFDWKKATLSEMPVSLHIRVVSQRRGDSTVRRTCKLTLDLGRWITNKNDCVEDVRIIAGKMRSLAGMGDAHAMTLRARALLRIREILSGLAADVSPREEGIRASSALRQEIRSFGRMKAHAVIPGSSRYSNRDSLYDDKDAERRRLSRNDWWENGIAEMTLDELHWLRTRRTRTALIARYRVDHGGEPPESMAQLCRAYRSEWHLVNRQEGRYKYILLDAYNRKLWTLEAAHAHYVTKAHKAGLYEEAVKDGHLGRVQKIVVPYPDIAACYGGAPRPGKGRMTGPVRARNSERP
jgi:hypothetical protein